MLKGNDMKRVFKLTLLIAMVFSLLMVIAIPSKADTKLVDVSVNVNGKNEIGKASEINSIVIKVVNNGPVITDVKVNIMGESSNDITPFSILVNQKRNPKKVSDKVTNGLVVYPNETDKYVIQPGKFVEAAFFVAIPKDTQLKRYFLRFNVTYKTIDGKEESKQDKLFIDVKSPNNFILALRWMLDMLSKIGNNYGIAVILFAILIKFILWPLNTITMKSQAQMQKLQPKINEINTKFKDDPAKKNEEIMRLYREEKINPASSCLYLLPQLVVLWLLYSALQGYVPLFNQSFLWLKSMGSPDPLFIFPILAGVSTFFQSLSSGQANDPQTKTFTYLMPVIFFYIMMNFPAALSIFWTVFGLVSWAQQYLYMKNKPKPATSAVEVKPRSDNKVGKK